MTEITDVAIVGAGPAGLQAALTVGRMHRTAVVFDSARYRNDPADALHNLIAHDGRRPSDLRAAARADLARYGTVRLVDATVERVAGSAGAFRLDTGAGEIMARQVILATGMRDTLPDIPGLAGIFGSVAAHCPFCHGHEYAGAPVALIGPAPFLDHMSALMAPIAASLTAFPHGDPLDAAMRESLSTRSIEVVDAPIAEIRRRGEGAEIRTADGAAREVGGILVRSDTEPAAPHARQLGLECSEMGTVWVDAFGRTSLPGVLAAGDLAQLRSSPGPMWSVANAIATGAAAGAGAIQALAAR